MAEQEQTDYRQQLGLKKILYKYENQNQQLRSQIKALNQRLQWILNKPKTPQIKKTLNPIQQYQGKILKQQMHKLYKQINNESIQMKINKDSIDERHEEKCKQLQNKIIKQEKQLKQLNHKLLKYQQLDEGLKVGLGTMMGSINKITGIQTSRLNTNNNNSNLANNNISMEFPTNILSINNKTLRSGTVRVHNYLQKLNNIKEQTQSVRRSIKQLEHQRDSNQRQLIKKHLLQNQVKTQNKLLQQNGTLTPKTLQIIQENPNSKKKGIWGMENTKENYQFIKAELDKLKKQKDTTLQMIKNQNIVLSNKLKELQNQLDGLNRSIEIPPIPYQKRQLKIPIDLSISTKFQSPLLQKKSLKPIQLLDQTEFQRKNDKNFVPKISRKVQWQSTKNSSGIQWNDSQVKSPIIGMNLWFDGHLLGLQVLHELGSSGQQLQVLGGKKLIPIQYRLSTGDYVQNIIIYISDGFIHGIQFLSKNGRGDKFGNISKARKFDFGIKKPQKPVVSFGQYKITNNVSEITKLGFEVI